MKVLVTGAAGFIGAHLVERLLNMGHDIRALVRSTEQTTSLAWYKHPRVELCYGCFSEAEACDRLLQGMDIVVHLAATRSMSWQEQKQRTVEDPKILVNLSKEHRI